METSSTPAVNFVSHTPSPQGGPQLKRRRIPGSTPNPNRDGRCKILSNIFINATRCSLKTEKCLVGVAVLSLFTVVQFANQPCAAASGDNGTCLTLAECASRGGLASGPCAGNFGVCCVCKSARTSKASLKTKTASPATRLSDKTALAILRCLFQKMHSSVFRHLFFFLTIF